MLTSPAAFASYFAAVRQRTLTYVQIIPRNTPPGWYVLQVSHAVGAQAR